MSKTKKEEMYIFECASATTNRTAKCILQKARRTQAEEALRDEILEALSDMADDAEPDDLLAEMFPGSEEYQSRWEWEEVRDERNESIGHVMVHSRTSW